MVAVHYVAEVDLGALGHGEAAVLPHHLKQRGGSLLDVAAVVAFPADDEGFGVIVELYCQGANDDVVHLAILPFVA